MKTRNLFLLATIFIIASTVTSCKKGLIGETIEPAELMDIPTTEPFAVRLEGGNATSNFITGSWYCITNVHSGKVLRILNAKYQDGQQIVQGTWDTALDQQWQLIPYGTGFHIYNRKMGQKVVDVASNSTADGANLQTYALSGTDVSQKWEIEAVGSAGYVRFTNAHSGKVMAVQSSSTADDANVIQSTFTGANNQLWKIQRVLDPPPVLDYLRGKLYERNNLVYVIAHRGVHTLPGPIRFPENSGPSVQAAIDNGIDMVEIDIQRTADGVLVLMHDVGSGSVNQTTTGTGNIQSMTYAQVRNLRLRTTRNGPATLNDTVPTLSQIMDISKGKLALLLDCSGQNVIGDIMDMVYKKNMLDEVAFFTDQDNSSQIAAMDYLARTDKRSIIMPGVYSQNQYNTHQPKHKMFLVDYTNQVFPQSIYNGCGVNVAAVKGGNPATESITGLSAGVSAAVGNYITFIQTNWPAEVIQQLDSLGRRP